LKRPDPVKTQCLFRPILERTGSALIAAHEADCPYIKGLVEGQRAGDGAREWPQGDRPFAVIGDISNGLKSRERSCPYAFLAPGSGV